MHKTPDEFLNPLLFLEALPIETVSNDSRPDEAQAEQGSPDRMGPDESDETFRPSLRTGRGLPAEHRPTEIVSQFLGARIAIARFP